MTTIRNVTCDNCSASYPIDFSKLKRERNRITCKRCQHKVVFFKSAVLEPQNEAAQIDHADEKTLVEEDRKAPNVQQSIQNDPQTAVSTNQPPVLSSVPPITKEVSDPTIRRQSPLPTEEKPQINVRKSNLQSNKNVAQELADKAPKSKVPVKKKSGSDPLGLRGALQLCTGMMILGLVSIAGMHFAPDTIGDMAFLVGSSSLTLGALWLITSDFGFSKPSMGLSVGGASIVAIATGALVFGSAEQVEPSKEEAGVEVPAEILPTVEVAEKQEQDLTQKEASFDRSKSKSTGNKNKGRSMGATSATVRDADKSNKAHKEMFAAANQYINSKETPSSVGNDDEPLDQASRPSDVVAPSDPDELLEDDLDLDGFDDLGLDDEEEKKGLFGRKDKNESKSAPKPEKKPEPKPKSSGKKVNVEQHILDIIIRNNKDVKSCYAQVRAETGTFPKVTDVMFTLQPTGKVSSAYIASGPYVGSKFEGCLRAAFKGMTFPTSDSDATAQTLKYTFRL